MILLVMKGIAWMDKVDTTTITTVERSCENFMGSSGALVALQGGTLLVAVGKLVRRMGVEARDVVWWNKRDPGYIAFMIAASGLCTSWA